MYSVIQPKTSESLLWNGQQEALGNSNLSTNTNRVVIVNGDGDLELSEQIPATNLPSYVDDVVNYTSYDDFPVTGETGKIYIETDTNHSFRWNGSGYSLVSSNPYVLFYDHFNTALQLNENYPTLGQKYPTWKRDFSLGHKHIYQGGYVFCTDIGSAAQPGDAGYSTNDGILGVLHFQFIFDSANRKTLMHQKIDASNNDIENGGTFTATNMYATNHYVNNTRQPEFRNYSINTSATTAGVPVTVSIDAGFSVTSVTALLNLGSVAWGLTPVTEAVSVTPVNNGDHVVIRVLAGRFI